MSYIIVVYYPCFSYLFCIMNRTIETIHSGVDSSEPNLFDNNGPEQYAKTPDSVDMMPENRKTIERQNTIQDLVDFAG